MGTPFDNADGRPTFGFVRYHFSPKRRCVTCNRRVYVGIVNIHAPDAKVMCLKCYDALDEGAVTIEDLP